MKRNAAIYSLVTVAMAILLVASCRKGDSTRKEAKMDVNASYEDSGYYRSCKCAGQTVSVIQLIVLK